MVRGPEGEVSLTSNEVKVLGVLAAHPGQVFDRDRLLCEALGYNKSVVTRAIDQAIWRLRRKIEPEPHQPRWLRSEANAGYRLVLDPPPPREAPFGRQSELERLDALLERHGSAVVVGLPGSGRHALVAALAARRKAPIEVIEPGAAPTALLPGGRTVFLAVSMPVPEASRPPVLRLGPLEPVDGEGLLVSAILAARGATELSEAEEALVPAIAARAGHHPGTLLAVAEHATLRSLGELGALPVDARIARHVASLPAPVRSALAALALFPDPFRPDEVEGLVPSDTLDAAWRAGVIEVAGSVDRGLVVPPCVRVALGEPPSAATTTAFVERIIEELLPLAARCLETGSHADHRALMARSARLDAAYAAALPEQALRLLPALLVRGSTQRIIPEILPDPGPEATADDRTSLLLLRAWQLENRDPPEAQRLGTELLTLDPSPALGALAVRSAWFLRFLPPLDDRVLKRAAALAERSELPMVRATYIHLRGLSHLRAARNEEAREDLREALRLYPPGSVQLLLARNHLGGEAARDGRVHEALAWFDQIPAHPSDEAGSRARRLSLLLAAGDLAAARQELVLLDLLEGVERTAEAMRAAMCLLEGRVEEAAVLAESACLRPLPRGGHAFGSVTVLAWVRVVQGLCDAALQLVEQLETRIPMVNGDYPAQVALLRVAALARAGRVEEARADLERLEPVPLRWWPVARRVVAAGVDVAAGGFVDTGALRREVQDGRLLHLVTQFAMAVLEGTRPEAGSER